MIRIGKIVATHGLKGQVVFTHLLTGQDWLRKVMPLFVELRKGSRIPFFMRSLKPSGDDAYLLHLEETETVEQARALVGRPVFVDETKIKLPSATDSPLLWIGFRMKDESGADLGELEDVYQTPAQWLGELRHEGREVLIPLVPEVVKSVNLAQRTIVVDLPEGLLEV